MVYAYVKSVYSNQVGRGFAYPQTPSRKRGHETCPMPPSVSKHLQFRDGNKALYNGMPRPTCYTLIGYDCTEKGKAGASLTACEREKQRSKPNLIGRVWRDLLHIRPDRAPRMMERFALLVLLFAFCFPRLLLQHCEQVR